MYGLLFHFGAVLLSVRVFTGKSSYSFIAGAGLLSGKRAVLRDAGRSIRMGQAVNCTPTGLDQRDTSFDIVELSGVEAQFAMRELECFHRTDRPQIAFN